MTRSGRTRDRWAGLLTALIGLGAILEGWRYGIGTLASVGSGFFPVALGAGMVLMGALMAMAPGEAQAGAHGGGGQAHGGGPEPLRAAAPEWRSALAIVGGVALFILLADRAGLAPATFCCVFVAALGSRATRPVEAALLALAVTVFGVALFRYGLQVQFPVLRGVVR